jgi:hypothetical protein
MSMKKLNNVHICFVVSATKFVEVTMSVASFKIFEQSANCEIERALERIGKLPGLISKE